MKYVVVAVALCASACNEPAPSPAAAGSASARAVAASASGKVDPDKGMMTLSTKSAEARAAFARGRELADNAHEPAAIEQFKKATELDPSFAVAHACFGYYSAEDEGLKALEHAVSLGKALPEPERLYIEELMEMRRGNIAKAREHAQRIVQLVPFDWHAQLDLGNRFFAERRLDEAAEHLRKAAAYGPPSAAVLNQLGYVQLTQRDFGGAVGTFRKYTQLRPDEPNALDSMGEALLNSNRLDESEQFFQKAADLKFSYGHSGSAYVRFLKGDEAGGMAALAKAKELSERPLDKLDVDLIGIWAVMPRPDDAKKRITAYEVEAEKQKLYEHYGNASIARAVALLEGNAPADAATELEQALKRADNPALNGAPADRLRRAAYGWRAVAQLQAGKAADVQKTSEAMDKVAAASPAVPELQSMASLGRGLSALAKGDAAAAVKEMSTCPEEDLLCQWQLAAAQEKGGDKKTADETRAKITRVKLRMPQYLYVHAKLAGKSPPPK